MQPDERLITEDVRNVLQEGILNYPGEDFHLSVFALYRKLDWNELQKLLGSADSFPSNPQKIKAIVFAVEEHLFNKLSNYLKN
ncbi:hypothetical protein OSG_eHP25_00095 [environmental Halophage eHP-25]|nr:hypothetical protein OSG_eHP25_00095 [environmental Halophage eHP-25]